MNTELRDRLYNDWLAADFDWTNELYAVYGNSASEKRYDHKYNAATERLAYLRQRFIDTGTEYRKYTQTCKQD